MRIGLPPVGSDILFAPLFAIYRSRYPGVDIQLAEHGSERLAELVRAGELDLGAALMPIAADFDWQEVRREPIDALIAADDALAMRETSELKILSEMPFILFEPGFALNAIILDACRTAGFEPQVAARSSQIDFIIELVAARLGVGFLPRMIARQRQHPKVRHIAITAPAMDWHIGLIWRRGAYLPHAARAWLELAAEMLSPR